MGSILGEVSGYILPKTLGERSLPVPPRFPPLVAGYVYNAVIAQRNYTVLQLLRYVINCTHHISNRATRVLNLLRRNIYCCTADTKALAYTSLVRPHLEFASAAWDPYTDADSYQINKIQWRAAQFISKDYRRTSSVTQMMSKLGWESLADRRQSARLSLLYKGLHTLA